MFRGFCKSKLDGKGRVMVPSKYRSAIGDDEEIILTGNPDGCLMLYKLETFLALEQRVMSLPATDERALYYQQVIVGYADQLRLDSAGRVLINAQLREHAGLSREALLMGMRNHIRLWDETYWKKLSQQIKGTRREGAPSGWEDFTYV